jgi:hypothetical protein
MSANTPRLLRQDKDKVLPPGFLSVRCSGIVNKL